jgi:hypothetical protein
LNGSEAEAVGWKREAVFRGCISVAILTRLDFYAKLKRAEAIDSIRQMLR